MKKSDNIMLIIIEGILFGITGAIFTIPCILFYFFIILVIEPLQYVLIGKKNVADKFHSFVEYLMDKFK